MLGVLADDLTIKLSKKIMVKTWYSRDKYLISN